MDNLVKSMNKILGSYIVLRSIKSSEKLLGISIPWGSKKLDLDYISAVGKRKTE